MKSILITFIFALALLVFSCKSSQETTKTDSVQSQCIEMKLLTKSIDSLKMDPFDVDSLTIESDCLNVFVHYGGGCGEANFELYYTQIVAQSMPPQTSLQLSFEDNDNCRSIVSRQLSFDLEPFSEYANNGGIYLLIGGKRVLYKNAD